MRTCHSPPMWWDGECCMPETPSWREYPYLRVYAFASQPCTTAANRFCTARAPKPKLYSCGGV